MLSNGAYASSATTLQDLLHRLGAKPSGRGYCACCPAHDDRDPSLSISIGHDGKVLLCCHAGCTQESVIDALTAQRCWPVRSDNYHPPKPTKPVRKYDIGKPPHDAPIPVMSHPKHGSPARTHRYMDADGSTLFHMARYNLPEGKKTFLPWAWDFAAQAWVQKSYKEPRPLYRLDLLNSHPNRPVLVVEGEKAAEAAQQLVGDQYVAVTWPHGANSVDKSDWSVLKGRDVLIWPDADAPGIGAAKKLATILSIHCPKVQLINVENLNLPEGFDAADALEAGRTFEQFEALAESRAKSVQPNAKNACVLILDSLGDLMKRPQESTEWFVEGLLPAGGTSILVAKPKAGKTTLARVLTLIAAKGGDFLGRKVKAGKVIYLALEEKSSQVVEHYRAMGADGTEEIHIFAGVLPTDAVPEIERIALADKVVLIVVDTLLKAVKVKDASAYAEMSNALEPFTNIARKCGAHLMAVHHAGKAEKEGGDAILGSTAIAGAFDSILILKRGERYRTLQTIQRYGKDLEETTLNFDEQTRTITLGEDRATADENRLSDEIITFLRTTIKAATTAEIDDAVDGRKQLKLGALAALTKRGTVSRHGRGGRADPSTYWLTERGEPGNEGTQGSLGTQGTSGTSGTYGTLEVPGNLGTHAHIGNRRPLKNIGNLSILEPEGEVSTSSHIPARPEVPVVPKSFSVTREFSFEDAP